MLTEVLPELVAQLLLGTVWIATHGEERVGPPDQQSGARGAGQGSVGLIAELDAQTRLEVVFVSRRDGGGVGEHLIARRYLVRIDELIGLIVYEGLNGNPFPHDSGWQAQAPFLELEIVEPTLMIGFDQSLAARRERLMSFTLCSHQRHH